MIFASGMKWIAGLILVFLVVIQSFTPWMVIGQYAINKEYISKNLCINKNLPKLHCNGKCQLMKKLAEEEKQNAPAESSLGKAHTFVLFSQEIELPEISGFAEMKSGWPSLYLSSAGKVLPRSIFHPPIV